MTVYSKPDWLTAQERKRSLSIFLLEWLFLFALALLFWTLLFFKVHPSFTSAVTAVVLSSLYACTLIYARLLSVTRCRKCKGLLPLGQEEIGRRHIHDEERCVEVEHGGSESIGHWIDTYSGIDRVEMVRYRCRRCHSVWDEMERSMASSYKLIRRTNLKGGK